MASSAEAAESSPEAPAQQVPQSFAQAKPSPPQDKISKDATRDTTSRQLTFLRQYFTKPLPTGLDTTTESGDYIDPNRHFSFTSKGFIILSTTMILALIAAVITAAVIGSEVHHHHHHGGEDPRFIHPHYSPDSSPIRSAIVANFPDPALWYDNGTWYAYATNNAAGIMHVQNANASENTISFGLANVQLATSNDFTNWTITSLDHDPLPTVGAWSRKTQSSKLPRPLSGTWAPGVGRRADGKYVMYYAAPWAGANPRPNHPPPHCVGAAVSTGYSPSGPYEAEAEALACPTDSGGAIDPEAYSENNTLWVVYKVDGNNVGNGGECGNTVKPIHPTPIMLQKMMADGITRDGEPVQILDRIASDGPLVEAPMIVRSAEGIYFLFFSSGCTRTPSYAVKYATSKELAEPYKRAKNTLLETGDWGLQSPGSVGIHDDGKGGWNMAFHARVYDAKLGGIRAMFTTKLEFDGHMVTMVRDNTTKV